MLPLQKSFTFSQDDLAINRAGSITDGQRKFLEAASAKEVRSMNFLRTGFGVLGSLCVAIAVLFGNPSLLLVGGWILIWFTVTTLILHRSVEKLRYDLDEGLVLVAEGTVEYPLKRKWGRVYRPLTVDTVELTIIMWRLRRTLEEGEFWRVYYLPRTKYILSAEQ